VQVTRRRGWRLGSDLVVFASHCRAHVALYFYFEPLSNYLDRWVRVYGLQAVGHYSLPASGLPETQRVRILGGVLLSAETADTVAAVNVS